MNEKTNNYDITNWDRVFSLNFISTELESRLCRKLEVPIHARKHLPVSVQLKILGNERLDEENKWFWDLKGSWINDWESSDAWRFIEKTYGQNPGELSKKLRQILEFELTEAECDEKLSYELGESRRKLNNLKTIIQKFEGYPGAPYHMYPSDSRVLPEIFQQILTGLQKATSIFIELINKFKHAKRYEKNWEWPICLKTQGWIDELFDQCFLTFLKLLHKLSCLHGIEDPSEVARTGPRKYFIRLPRPTYSSIPWVERIRTETDELLLKILNSAFLPEVNPPRFVRKGEPFHLKYRFLLGRHALDSLKHTYTAEVSIINDNQFENITANNSEFDTWKPPTGILENFKTGVWPNNVESSTGHLIIEFPACKVAKRKLNPTRGTQNDKANVPKFYTPIDEKFCFVCTFTFCIEGYIPVKIMTLSQPVLVGSTPDHELRSLGIILWDNAICEPQRTTMVVPDRMLCSKLIDGLDELHMIHAKIPLSNLNRFYLTNRVLKREGVLPENEDEVTFDDFCNHEFSDNCRFTFWTWFINGLKLGEEFFQDVWRNGYIVGFLESKYAFALLSLSPSPARTIVIHFSHSSPGTLLVSWINDDCDRPMNMEERIDKSVLATTTLPKIIEGLSSTHKFRFFYPNQVRSDFELSLLKLKPPPGKALATETLRRC